jgi:hypothetical protein
MSRSPFMAPADECGQDRAWDAVRVEMIAHMREMSPLTGCPDGVLRPTEEHSNLSNVEWPRAVLEHLWNTTAVHGWGSLVRIDFNGCYAPEEIRSVGDGW